ncbi:MAG: sodium:calcium antiporter [Candidatus Nealsonbacteria bacterium]|nr:MAG: sodium:calcium antiporter [Candidatus Nealsonbacteria bacterium]
MELLFWIGVFIISLFFLVKGADWFVESSEKLGLIMGLSPFIVGVTIVALGTSLPELVTGISAVLKGATEIVTANAIGSNIANILLVLGVSALFAGKLIISRSLIDIDLPLLLVASFLFLGTAWDGQISWQEAILLLVAFFIYFFYSVTQRAGKEESQEVSILPAREKRHLRSIEEENLKSKPKFNWKIILFLTLGSLALYFGAHYIIESTLRISEILKIVPAVVAITAIAVGTSLPELVVSVQAARRRKYELAVGNALGSNIFNILVVVGIPALISDLVLEEETKLLALGVFVAATLFFVISGISQRIHRWEGAIYLLFYAFFIGKLFNLL